MNENKNKAKNLASIFFAVKRVKGILDWVGKKDLDIVLYYKDLSNDEWWRRLADRLGGLPAQGVSFC